MSYIGNKPATNFETVQKQISTSNSGTTITLDRAVTSVQDILLTIDAVVQSYDNYSVSGTTLTVGGTLNNNRVEILYVGRTMQSVDPTDDSVSASKIKTDAVTTAKVQNDAITVDKLNLISTSSVPSIEAKGDGSVEGKITWNCENNSHGQTIQASPHSSGQSWTLKLPDNSPTADKFLKVKSITGSGSTATGQLEFADAGGLVLLLDTTLSNSASFTADNTILTTTYKKYIIDCVNLELQSQSHVALTGSSNNGSSYISSGYQYTNFIMTSAMSNNEYYTRMNNSASAIDFVGNAQTITNDKHIDARIELYNPTGGNDYKRILFHAGYSNTSNQEITVIGTGTFGGGIGTDALNNIKIAAGTGNLKSGSIKVYGVV